MRFAPALAQKPTKSDSEKQAKPQDPFAPPYQPDLFVAEDVVKEDQDDQGECFVVLVRERSLGSIVSEAHVGSDIDPVEQVLRDASALPPRDERIRQANDSVIAC